MAIHREHERGRLVLALDRQGRADTTEAWTADQAVIDNALDRLEQAGCDRAHEAAEADRIIARWSAPS